MDTAYGQLGSNQEDADDGVKVVRHTRVQNPPKNSHVLGARCVSSTIRISDFCISPLLGQTNAQHMFEKEWKEAKHWKYAPLPLKYPLDIWRPNEVWGRISNANMA